MVMRRTGASVVRGGVAALALFAVACGGPGDADDAAADSLDQQSGQPQGAGTPGAAPRTSSGLQASSSSGLVAQDISLDSTGWVLQPPFYAAGDEPYWRLEILDGWFVFRRSGLPEIESPIVQPTTTRGVDLFESPPLQVSVRARACKTLDGLDGVAAVIVSFDGIDYTGCGFPGQSVGDATGGAAVADAIGAIDACLANLDEPALVTGIYAREGDRTALGLRTHNGSLYECAVESDDQTVAYLDPVEPGAANAWMTSRMRFLRAGQTLEKACPAAEDVTGPDGVLGVSLPDSCRF